MKLVLINLKKVVHATVDIPEYKSYRTMYERSVRILLEPQNNILKTKNRNKFIRIVLGDEIYYWNN